MDFLDKKAIWSRELVRLLVPTCLILSTAIFYQNCGQGATSTAAPDDSPRQNQTSTVPEIPVEKQINLVKDSSLEMNVFEFFRIEYLPLSKVNVISAPENGEVIVEGSGKGSLRYQPVFGFNGLDRVVLSISDSSGKERTYIIKIDVKAVGQLGFELFTDETIPPKSLLVTQCLKLNARRTGPEQDLDKVLTAQLATNFPSGLFFLKKEDCELKSNPVEFLGFAEGELEKNFYFSAAQSNQYWIRLQHMGSYTEFRMDVRFPANETVALTIAGPNNGLSGHCLGPFRVFAQDRHGNLSRSTLDFWGHSNFHMSFLDGIIYYATSQCSDPLPNLVQGESSDFYIKAPRLAGMINFEVISPVSQSMRVTKSVELNCGIDQHVEYEGDRAVCVDKVIDCQTDKGRGTQSWSSGSWGTCQLNSCFSIHDTLIESQCIPIQVSCHEGVGSGNKRLVSLSINTYGPCVISDCESGYHVEYGKGTVPNRCAPNERSCIAKFNDASVGKGVQFWRASRTFGACEARSCMPGFHVEGKSCLPNIKSCTIPVVSGDFYERSRGYQEWNGATLSYGVCQSSFCSGAERASGEQRCVRSRWTETQKLKESYNVDPASGLCKTDEIWFTSKEDYTCSRVGMINYAVKYTCERAQGAGTYQSYTTFYECKKY